MPRTVYVNGAYVAPEDAKVSIFDRGLLFADAIYEVAGVIDGKLLDFASHMARLDRSLVEMRIPAPMTHSQILEMMREMVRLNEVWEGLVYMQITRGSDGDRDFLPSDGLTPTVFAFAQHKSEAEKTANREGIAMVTGPDIRWARRDIKTVGLMGSVFAKWTANEAGGDEVLMHQDGFVTEGGATSFYIVKDGAIITRPLSQDILHGCTRRALLQLVETGGVRLTERLFTPDEARAADEAFITGASTYVCPVVQIDGAPIGDGLVGPITRRLQDIYEAHARADAI